MSKCEDCTYALLPSEHELCSECGDGTNFVSTNNDPFSQIIAIRRAFSAEISRRRDLEQEISELQEHYDNSHRFGTRPI